MLKLILVYLFWRNREPPPAQIVHSLYNMIEHNLYIIVHSYLAMILGTDKGYTSAK